MRPAACMFKHSFCRVQNGVCPCAGGCHSTCRAVFTSGMLLAGQVWCWELQWDEHPAQLQPVLTLESLQEHRGAHRTHTTKMPAQTEPQQLPLNPKLKRKSNSSNLNFSHFCAFVSVFRAPTNKATDTMPPPRETQTQLLPSAPSPSPLYSAKQIVL